MLDASGRWYPDWPGQQPYQDPAYIRAYGQNGFNNQQGQQTNNFQNGNNHNAFQQQQQPAQDMTPTIRAEIKQVPNLESIDRIPQAAGTTDAYMTKDEKIIVFRTMYANGEHADKIYDERPPAPPAPKFDPSEFMRRDEAQKIIAEQVETLLSAALTAQKAPQRKQAQEVE